MESRVVYYTAASLDGFLADPDNSLQWLFDVNSESLPNQEDFSKRIGAYVSGSQTYEWVLDAERLVEEPERWSGFFGEKPWFVFSSRQLPIPTGASVQLLNGSPENHFAAISEAAGDLDIWLYGGGGLVAQFFDAGLLHEIQVSVAPVTLGDGAPLLPRRIDSDRLHLESVERFDQFAHLTYAVT